MGQLHNYTTQYFGHDYIFIPRTATLSDNQDETGLRGTVLGWSEGKTVQVGDILVLGRGREFPSHYLVESLAHFASLGGLIFQFVAEVVWVAETQVEATLASGAAVVAPLESEYIQHRQGIKIVPVLR